MLYFISSDDANTHAFEILTVYLSYDDDANVQANVVDMLYFFPLIMLLYLLVCCSC